MISNCSRHLISELRILKPDLVVFHGIDLPDYMLRALEAEGISYDYRSKIINSKGKHVLYHVEDKVLSTYMLFLAHPTYGWLDGQWHDVVEPALTELRQLVPTLRGRT